MSRVVFKLPDLGEGTVQAEIVAWRVKPGDSVAEDDVIVEVMTDKAAVEVPSPVTGRVVSTTGNPGDTVPVGTELIVFETAAEAKPAATVKPAVAAAAAAAPAAAVAPAQGVAAISANGHGGNGSARGSTHTSAHVAARSGRVSTSPAIRRRAREAGVDLAKIPGSGPHGRIVRKDLEDFVATSRGEPVHVLSRPAPVRAVPSAGAPMPVAREGTEEIKVIGVRRLIAQKMSEAKRNIPHFAYVEEIDMTEVETLRRHLNSKAGSEAPSLTYLPFLVMALVRVLQEFPQCNATYDAERGVIVRYRSVHVGVATQTPDGLKVPVVRDAQALSLWDLAADMRRVTEAARTNTAKREELTGSTITVSSLGKLGGIASTPIINAPEVAIIGVNRAVERPVVVGGAITVRRMMNLSSSFDHRFVDGYDAAAMIQALKERLEHPATVFLDLPRKT
jgi:2-oxoisovalerate dehydrogenase E2 component (dihydrolipoyl transacylase)